MDEAAQRIARQWGDNIRSLRIGGGTRTKPAMSQSALADRLCVTATTIWRWEHGLVPPPLEFQLRLASAFRVAPALLFPLPQVIPS